MSNCHQKGGKRTKRKRRTGKKCGGSAGFLNKLAVPATLLIARTSLMGPPRVNGSNKTKRRRRRTRK